MATAFPNSDPDCFLILRNGKRVPITHTIPSPESLERKIDADLNNARVQKKPVLPNPSEDDSEMTTSVYTPGYFSGKSGESPEDFLDNVKAYCALRNDTAPEKFLPLALKEGAKAWYLTLEDPDKSDWDKISTKFKERYNPPKIMNFARVGDLFESKQGENESVRDYISRVQHACHVAKLDNDMTMKAVLNGLRQSLQTFVLAKDPKTLPEIEKHAIMAELVTPKPVATTSLQEAVDDIKLKMDKLLVASSSPNCEPRSRSPSTTRYVRFEDHNENRAPPNWNQQRGRPFRSPRPFRRQIPPFMEEDVMTDNPSVTNAMVSTGRVMCAEIKMLFVINVAAQDIYSTIVGRAQIIPIRDSALSMGWNQ